MSPTMDTSVAVFYLPNSLRTELFRKEKKGKEKRVRKGRKEKGKEEKGRGRKGKERGKEKQSILNFKLIFLVPLQYGLNITFEI